jgi:hypothetical protein
MVCCPSSFLYAWCSQVRAQVPAKEGGWLVRTNRVIYQAAPDGSREGAKESLGDSLALSLTLPVSRHFSQFLGSPAPPHPPAKEALGGE